MNQPPDFTTDEGARLRASAWYLNDQIVALQNEVSELRCNQHHDRKLLIELRDLVRLLVGVDPSVTLQ
jgi:hypothetical protein